MQALCFEVFLSIEPPAGQSRGQYLRLYFGNGQAFHAASGTGVDGQSPGYRHSRRAFSTDLLGHFKIQLANACHDEALLETDPRQSELLRIAGKSLSPSHSILVACEVHQPLGEVLSKEKELIWQPLDHALSFELNAFLYGFDARKPFQLHVAKKSCAQWQQSSRCLEFEHQQECHGHKLQEINSEEQCFGYSLCVHPHDNGSKEWRPAVLERSDETRDCYRAKYVYCPSAFNSSTEDDEGYAVVKREDVRLTPSKPKILGSEHVYI